MLVPSEPSLNPTQGPSKPLSSGHSRNSTASLKTDDRRLVHRQVLHLKKSFFVVTISHLTLGQKWEVSLYSPSAQKTLKIYFTMKQLVKLQLMIQRGKQESNQTQSLIQVRSKSMPRKHHLNHTKMSNDESNQRSPTSKKHLEGDHRFSRGALRSFDKSTGGFLDKEFT